MAKESPDPLDEFMSSLGADTSSNVASNSSTMNGVDPSDPLDVFMRSVSATTSSTKKRARLDIEGEEEQSQFEEEIILFDDYDDVDDGDERVTREGKKKYKIDSAGTNMTPLLPSDRSIPFPRDTIRFDFLPANYHRRSKHTQFPLPPNPNVTLTFSKSRISPPPPIPPNSLISAATSLLDFPEALSEKISALGYTHFTDIQRYSIPLALAGHDLLCTAPTGSGKTLSFVWPAVIHATSQRIVEKGEGPIVLILSPTRELSKQTFVEMNRFLKCLGGSAVSLTGGATSAATSTYELSKELKKGGVEAIVATPGRLIDMVKKKVRKYFLVVVFFLSPFPPRTTRATRCVRPTNTYFSHVNPPRGRT